MLRSIALYLPQFHPIPENNAWWGEGFTEWTNVTKARPLYAGHYQPHLPADLGFYDLRLPLVMEQQAALAKQYGIDGFCFYHYWFNGRLLLEGPLEQMLRTGTPDMPFMLCWANENWSRRWEGNDQDLLMEQNYGAGDDEAHMAYLLPFLQDPRYIRINGKPVIAIYKTFLIPDPAATARTWRTIAAVAGIELYLCHMAFGYAEKQGLEEGFDAVIDFEPFGVRRPDTVWKAVQDRRDKLWGHSTIRRAANKLGLNKLVSSPAAKYNVLDYEAMYADLKPLKSFGHKIFPSLVPGWDNTARKPKDPTLILEGTTPQKFRAWLDKVRDDFQPYSPEENLLFINAWNEWAEGNHLEPDRTWGRQYLEQVRASKEQHG